MNLFLDFDYVTNFEIRTISMAYFVFESGRLTCQCLPLLLVSREMMSRIQSFQVRQFETKEAAQNPCLGHF